MALNPGVKSAAKSCVGSEVGLVRWRRLFWKEKEICDSNTSVSLTKRLLQEPTSSIKTTLDSLVLQPSQFTLETLLSSLTSSSSASLDKAHLVLEWSSEKLLKENERDHDKYSELIYLCGKIRNLPLAMNIFTSMEARGIKPNSSIFNSLIHVCFSSGNMATALSLFEIMQSSEGFKPNSDTYEAFISGFSKLGNVNAMQAWYSAKKAAGFAAQLQTYESLISGCIKSRNFETADGLFREMILTGFVPNSIILDSMLEGLCKRRNLVGAKKFLNLVVDGGWDINELMVEKLVGLYFEVGNVEDMEELLATLMEANKASEILSPVHCGIIRMYTLLDRLDDVEYAVGRMLKQGLSFKCADDIEKVICSYFRRAAYDRLDLFLERIKSSYELTRSTYDLLVAGYRRAGLSDKLHLVINDMKSAGC
ncbi:pentatricopeptide repeat-containing protein At5g04810, chloroplastic-like [Ziziphus jujuba]|uniref:Pentatricopeptide repeat-containing protein At5g04810, chloroplastic-like n=1 Tax=Ziziphus jujuba TaxID=326968 RepID=A0ABM3IMD0_ZIZJJ|nr:pentatricopeptide repeat-containing protein At5g04810, chloroplastic-like [Ziziphus jujuba]